VVAASDFGGMIGQMNGAVSEESPDGQCRRGLTGHSPALARLFLVGLRPRRARLRFTGRNKYRTSGKQISFEAREEQAQRE
jgi:hypothetical protein